MNIHNTLLIFDCDGILVDSEPIANKAIIRCLRNEGFDVDEPMRINIFLESPTGIVSPR